MNTLPFSPRCVAHIVRPAEGGMLAQVNSLISGMPSLRSLAAAPDSVLRNLVGVGVSDRLTLPSSIPQSGLLRYGAKCGSWARAEKADLLHGHGLRWSPLFAAAAAKSRLPLVITLHNLLPNNSGLLTLLLMRIVLGRATRIIAVSQAVATGAASALGPTFSKKLRVVRNGIDLKPFDDSNADGRAGARCALGWPIDAPIALCVARLSPEKNVAAFVDAAAQILKSGSATVPSFFVAGDGPERENLAARVAGHAGLGDKFQFLGPRDDVPRLLRAANLLCVPSLEEGLGLVAIEAMAAGRPVVASRVGGLPEVVVDQQTGVLLDRRAGAGAFADAMQTLLWYPERQNRMGAEGAKRARSHFGAERMLAETRAVYEEALCSRV